MAIPTKIQKLNNLLFGGFPEGSVVLVKYREPALARALIPFLSEGKAICITTDVQPGEIGGDLKYIDAYSVERGLSPRPEDRSVASAGAINDISLDLSEEMRSADYKLLVVFSASTLLNKNPKDAVYSFFDVFGSRMRDKGGAVVLFVNLEDVDGRDLERLSASSNIVFEIRKDEEGVELSSNAFPLPLKVVMFSGAVTVR